MSYDLTNLPTPVVIFEIDDDSFHGHAKFARYLDTALAMRQLTDAPEIGMGYWMGENSTCYVAPFDALHLIAPDIAEQAAIVFVDQLGDAALLGKNDKGIFSRVIGRGKMYRFVDTENLDGFTLLKSGVFAASFT